MNTSTRFAKIPLPLLFALSLFGVAQAQDRPPEDSDPPGRVARLSYTTGQVSLQPAGVDDWAAASVNRPLTTGDKLWVDQQSRAELQVGSATVHLDQGTGFSFLNLDDNVMQIRLTDGAINLRVRHLDDRETVEVDTPNSAVSILRAGEYHIATTEQGDSTVVAVRSGESEVNAGGQATTVHSNEQGVFSGNPDSVQAENQPISSRDDFDAWSSDRDNRQARSVSAQYVAPDVVGSDDLDQYGDWSQDPEYGSVWYPTAVAVDWAPYRFGHWIWISPWGWTWVDEAPWGFAPFHYGRWAYLRSRWCWVPGPRRERALYAPALVAWMGGPRFGVSVSVGGGGGVGWFPLGPREVYVPGYHVSDRYVRNVNVSNTTIVNNTYITNVYNNRTNVNYRYQHDAHAVTAVSQGTFTSARPVAHNRMPLQARELASSNIERRSPALAPVRQSVLGPHILAPNAHRPPEHLVDRPVIAKNPLPPKTIPFERQQQLIRANGGRPIARPAVEAGPRNTQVIAPKATLAPQPAARLRQDRPPNAVLQSHPPVQVTPVPHGPQVVPHPAQQVQPQDRPVQVHPVNPIPPLRTVPQDRPVQVHPIQPERPQDRPVQVRPIPQDRPQDRPVQSNPVQVHPVQAVPRPQSPAPPPPPPPVNREVSRPANVTHVVPADRPHPQVERAPPPPSRAQKDEGNNRRKEQDQR